MLARRVIPTLLCRGRTLVKGERFNSWRSVGHVQQAARIHNAREVDELCVLDITATPAGRGPDFAFIEELVGECFMPVSVGGGIRSVDDVRELLRCGADKIVIGTAAIEDPTLIPKLRDKVGSQAVVVSIDYADGRVAKACGKYLTEIEVVAWAQACELHGAGEILLTAVVREGTMLGYDLETVGKVAAAVRIPVIAHGGAGSYEDMRKAIHAGAHAVAAGAMFQFTDQTPRGAALYLHKRGIEARV